jgi:hypothetical protein
MASVLISSVNFNGQIGNITFYPEIGGTVNIGLQTIPYTYTANDIYGTYDIYFSEYPITCSVTILNPYIPLDCDLVIDSSTPSPTSTPSSTNTPTPTSTLVPPTPTGTSVPPTSTPIPTSTSVPPTPTSTEVVESCVLFDSGCGLSISQCSCTGGDLISIYYKGTIEYDLPAIGGKFYRTLSNCQNNIDDWNNFYPHYFYLQKFEVSSNGTIINKVGCS